MKKIQAVIKNNRAIVILLSLSLLFAFSIPLLSGKSIYIPLTPKPSVTASPLHMFTYNGKTGKDALSLLKEKTTVAQDTSGLVISINNRKADASKKEYWSFYVNGKMSSVGPAEYQTKNTDTIEWKIETY